VRTDAFSHDFERETQSLVRGRIPSVAAAFVAVAAVSWLVQRQTDPARDSLAAGTFLLEAIVLLSAVGLSSVRRLERHAVLISSIAFATLPLFGSFYHLAVGIEAELLAMAIVCLMAALAAGLPSPNSPLLGLAGVAVVSGFSVVGAGMLETYRRNLFQANRDLQAAYEAVKTAGQTKNEFIANLSHELRTPLNTIVGYTDLLLDDDFGALASEMRAPIERISKSADNLRALINDLIDLALIETGRLRVDIKDVPLAPLFDELAAVTVTMLRDKPIRFRYSEPQQLAVKADAGRLRQILTNLVGNAAKYTPQGEIELRAEKRNGQVLIAVRDTGLGVPKEEIQAIFTPFYRGTRRGNAMGVGLGLSMSARLAELMGGEITVESDIGKGSTFTVQLQAS
jgi:signal transduction histidine kinase